MLEISWGFYLFCEKLNETFNLKLNVLRMRFPNRFDRIVPEYVMDMVDTRVLMIETLIS